MDSSPLKRRDIMDETEPTLPPPKANIAAPSLSASPPKVAGVKRPAPSLLPAFEPLSSSPGLPRPAKKQALANAFTKYPTPVPTSSTGILSSSPPRTQGLATGYRPTVVRVQSSLSERTPLSAVPTVELNENGETLLMGRSSHSSQHQLSANRLISRVHVKARYIPASEPFDPNKVEVVCNGWNGLKLHCQGKTWELAKGDTFTSETENADIMIDVQDARVMVQWPKKTDNLSDSSWDDSPRSRSRVNLASLQSSPLRRQTRIKSPESPTPAGNSSSSLNSFLANAGQADSVQIFEDAEEQELPEVPAADMGASFAQTEFTNSFSSDLSDPEDVEDPDEENDPIVHSFGPFGANISNRLAAVTAQSPSQPSIRVASGDSTAKPSAEPEEDEDEEEQLPPLNPKINVDSVTNHVVNQLAFSRLSSNPLSAILNNLPAEEKKDLTKFDLRRIIETTPCIGTITRQGKDAAGKALESEYYYMPEHDTDDSRRFAVTDGLRKPSLRACRKQHKQYYWKRPKTP